MVKYQFVPLKARYFRSQLMFDPLIMARNLRSCTSDLLAVVSVRDGSFGLQWFEMNLLNTRNFR